MRPDSRDNQKVLPMVALPQIVPSQICLKCKVCCRFPEKHSAMRPYFTEKEVCQAIDHGIDPSHFPHFAGCHVEVIPDVSGEGYVCPAFDVNTSHCRIYEVRPLDCQIYPFVVMWSRDAREVLLGWDMHCPFLVDEVTHTSSDNPLRAKTCDTSTLPENMLNFAQDLADRLQTEEMIATLGSHPQLIMSFQVDVRTIQNLPALTEKLIS